MADVNRVSYGTDSPKTLSQLVGLGLLALILGNSLRPWQWGSFSVDLGLWVGLLGIGFLLSALAMALFARYGKVKYRDRLLDTLAWRGDEIVLDVGTGRGLFAIGAAHRVPQGKVFGVDVWEEEDLSGNNVRASESNAEAEGVAHLVEFATADAIALPYKDGTFDVVLSNLCLHHIRSKSGRALACREIARVLKPNGTVLISDLRFVSQFADYFRENGFEVEEQGPFLFSSFPPLSVLKGTKLV